MAHINETHVVLCFVNMELVCADGLTRWLPLGWNTFSTFGGLGLCYPLVRDTFLPVLSACFKNIVSPMEVKDAARTLWHTLLESMLS